MAPRLRLVLASNNAGKLAELQALFAPLPLELVAQPSLGVPEAEEPHATFIENALAKARHAARAGGGAALADDSGLCVDALGGAPGVISAHYAAVPLPASAKRNAACRTRPTTGCCSNACRAQRDAVPASSAHWWRCVPPTTRSRWWPPAAGGARS